MGRGNTRGIRRFSRSRTRSRSTRLEGSRRRCRSPSPAPEAKGNRRRSRSPRQPAQGYAVLRAELVPATAQHDAVVPPPPAPAPPSSRGQMPAVQPALRATPISDTERNRELALAAGAPLKLIEYSLEALAALLTSNPTVPRDQDLAVAIHVICQIFALQSSPLTPECALRLIDLQGAGRFRIRAPQAALAGALIPAPAMLVQSLDTHTTALLEEHNAAYHQDKAQRQFWYVSASPEDNLRRCLQPPQSLGAHVQGLSDLRGCTWL